MQTKILLLIVLLTSCVAPAQNLADAPSAHHYVATAQNLADAPSVHNYWDRTNKILVIAHIGLETADFIATHHNLSAGGKELNPLARPFCDRGTAGQVTYFAGQTATIIGLSYLLHRRGHHRLERILIGGANVSSAHGAIYSFSHR